MSPAADDGLLEFSHHFQGVPQVARGLRFAQPAKYNKNKTNLKGPCARLDLLLFKMFIELLHYYVMAQSQWAHYNTV
jgi:hypothetical protein